MTDVATLGRPWTRPSDGNDFIVKGKAAVRLVPFDTKSVNLMEISTVSYERGKGEASSLLKDVCQLADKHGVTIYANAHPIKKTLADRPLPAADLLAWYKRNGFVEASEPAARGVNIVRKPQGKALEEAESPSGLLTLWHGGRNLESGYMDFISHGKGSWEHGPGLYLTANRDVAAKYAKGGNAMYKVTVDLDRNIDDVFLSDEEVKDFVNRFVIGRQRKEFVELAERSRTRRSLDKLPAEVLINLSINMNAVQNAKTGEFRRWLVNHGVGYVSVENYGGWGVEKGQVYVIVDPKLIKKVERERS